MLLPWLKELIALPSLSGQEALLAAYLTQWGRSRGLETHEDAGNVMVRLPGRDRSRALLLHAPAFVFGPGNPESIHQADEYVDIANLRFGYEVIRAFVYALA